MNLRSLIYSLSMTLISFSLYSAQIENVQGPVHEAFLTPIVSSTINQAISATPPDVLLERIPQQPDSGYVWIPGYWQWDNERSDFIWISGVWRLPPPEREWISGFWQKFNEGWVWINGYWSDAKEESVKYVTTTPPDPIDEEPTKAPGDNYFWSPGYWAFDEESNEFNWVSGGWVGFDPDWILVPAHYVWRTTGYVLVTPYWDWNLENRGISYTSLFIPNSERHGYIYDPVVKVEPTIISRYYFNQYPDYLYFYHHNYHFYPNVWVNWNISPPWWGWNSWWSLNNSNNWALWWWWGHPGYPAPAWMSKNLAQQIAPPSKAALKIFKDAIPPAFVTPKGVVRPNQLLDAIQENVPASKRKPILPPGKRAIDSAADKMAELSKNRPLDVRPSGKMGPIPARLDRPRIVDDQAVPKKIDRVIPKIPGTPSVMRPKPLTPGSDVKPAIPRAIFTPKVPNLKPVQDRALKGDLFKTPGQVNAGRDRGNLKFEAPIKGDRPPYNNPTQIIRTPNPRADFSPGYEAPSYTPSYRDSNLPGTIYDAPQSSRAIIIRKDVQRERYDNRDGKPTFFPPRPDKDRTGSNIRQERRADRAARREERSSAREQVRSDRGARREARQAARADQPNREAPRAEQGQQRDKQLPKNKPALAVEDSHDEYIVAMAHEDPTLVIAAKRGQKQSSDYPIIDEAEAPEGTWDTASIPEENEVVRTIDYTPDSARMVTPRRDPSFRVPSKEKPKVQLAKREIIAAPVVQRAIPKKQDPGTFVVMTKAEQMQSLLAKQSAPQSAKDWQKLQKQRKDRNQNNQQVPIAPQNPPSGKPVNPDIKSGSEIQPPSPFLPPIITRPTPAAPLKPTTPSQVPSQDMTPQTVPAEKVDKRMRDPQPAPAPAPAKPQFVPGSWVNTRENRDKNVRQFPQDAQTGLDRLIKINQRKRKNVPDVPQKTLHKSPSKKKNTKKNVSDLLLSEQNVQDVDDQQLAQSFQQEPRAREIRPSAPRVAPVAPSRPSSPVPTVDNRNQSTTKKSRKKQFNSNRMLASKEIASDQQPKFAVKSKAHQMESLIAKQKAGDEREIAKNPPMFENYQQWQKYQQQQKDKQENANRPATPTPQSDREDGYYSRFPNNEYRPAPPMFENYQQWQKYQQQEKQKQENANRPAPRPRPYYRRGSPVPQPTQNRSVQTPSSSQQQREAGSAPRRDQRQ